MLGGFQLTGADGTDLSPPGKKLRALIALLALGPEAGWPRERLTALLWGDRDEEQARGSLRQALAELRRSLGDAALQADRETVAFNPGAVSIDAREFAGLAAAGEMAQASALYRGDLLDGVSLPDAEFADWLLIERTRLHDMAVGALGRLLASQSGEPAAATAQRLLQLEPASEEAHRALMRHYAACGDRAHALRQFQLCRDSLQRDLGVKPEPETERLYKELQSAPHNGSGRHRSKSAAGAAAPHESRADVGRFEADDKDTARAAAATVLRRQRGWMLALCALVLLIASAVVAVLIWSDRESAQPPVTTIPPQGVPIIVVLPLEDLTGTQAGMSAIDLGKVGRGIGEQVWSGLSTFPDFQVVSYVSSVTYAGKSVPEIQRITHATLVIGGAIRVTGGKARVTVEIINADADRPMEIAKIEEDLVDPVVLQQRAGEKIIGQLGGMSGRLRERLVDLARSKPKADLTEYDYYILGHDHMFQGETAEVVAAGGTWKEGLARFPDSVLLRCKLSFVEGWLGRNNGKHGAFIEAKRLVDEAVSGEKKSRLDDWYIHYAQAILARDSGDRAKAESQRQILSWAWPRTIRWSTPTWRGYTRLPGSMTKPSMQ